MFERLLQGLPRLAARGKFFARQRLLTLQLRNPLLVGRDHGRVARFDDAVEQGFDLLVDLADAGTERLRRVSGFGKAHVPCVLEHRLDQSEKVL
ncbi:hypothetical protein [Amaricoccus solimangrovi]|uniref:Uncharacterized protein n=1 Tax=Amaricoccus solimangrovi TaxID=2589815 RepID=A0A501WS01_9RHOB|nr:hypothetical protein [Amaricoccus solimangrovi]TPE48556.1 hypothetical protein FJM51_17585 [Amaricoccus solimangrovi]